MHYHPRIVDSEIQRRLESSGAVVIEGPKACGKTTTGRRFAESEVRLDVDENARRAIAIDPSLVLDGETPRLIDEWQIEPTIWNHIRRAVDDRAGAGQFILTGSAVPADDITRHSGAGRLSRVRMRPMSLFEMSDSTGEVSLLDLLDGSDPRCSDPGLVVADLTEMIARGGWPGLLERTTEQAVESVRDYVGEIRRTDIGRVDETRRDPQKVGRLLRAYARNIGTYASNATLAADAGGPDDGLHDATVSEYLSALDRLMVIEELPAWAPHLRSRSRVRGTVKRLFTDPSLAVAALRATPDRLLEDLNLLGFLFESLVIRDLRIHARNADARVLQYRDGTGLEVDAVVEAADGRWAAFEIKLGTDRIDDAAASLLKFAGRVDTEKCGEPTVLAVITATGYGYVREDGIGVFPVGALGP